MSPKTSLNVLQVETVGHMYAESLLRTVWGAAKAQV